MNDRAALLIEALELRAMNGLNTPPDLFVKLRNCAYANTLIIFKDQLNRQIGYLAFAEVNKESVLRFLKAGIIPFYSYEWGEGCISLIIDILVQKSSSFDAVRQLKEVLYSKRVIIFSKRNKRKLYLKKNGKLIQQKCIK